MAGCHTLLICAYLWEAFSARMFCVFCVFCGEFVHCFVGAALLVHLRQVHPLKVPPLPSDSVRHPIRFRPPPNRFPSATQSVSVRRPIGFRPPPNRFPSAVRSDSVRHPIGFRPPPNRFPSAVRSDSVRHPIRFRLLHDAISSVCTLRRLHCNTPHVPLLHPFMFAKLRNKFDF